MCCRSLPLIGRPLALKILIGGLASNHDLADISTDIWNISGQPDAWSIRSSYSFGWLDTKLHDIKMSSTTQHPLLVEIDGKTWFHERNPQWDGIALTLEVKQVLYHQRSKFQVRLLSSSSITSLTRLHRTSSCSRVLLEAPSLFSTAPFNALRQMR